MNASLQASHAFENIMEDLPDFFDITARIFV